MSSVIKQKRSHLKRVPACGEPERHVRWVPDPEIETIFEIPSVQGTRPISKVMSLTKIYKPNEIASQIISRHQTTLVMTQKIINKLARKLSSVPESGKKLIEYKELVIDYENITRKMASLVVAINQFTGDYF